ncbi:asparagine synthase-related protein [Halobellus rufus]|uniref:asparagine synthase-related protein n=1 Tax=Halobellus rufus TaxID=1448860 RepID=UPI0009DE99B9|nr:asparagine synthase-related protein [Halobellus rufus]
MVGFSALFSSQTDIESPKNLINDHLCWTGNEIAYDYSGEKAEVSISFHEYFSERQPVTAREDVFIWIWGDLKGYEIGDKYQSRDESMGKAELCTKLYNKFGLDFVSKLNGEFAGIIYDRQSEIVHAFTDQLGSRPIYVARGDDNELVLSTQIQLIPEYSSITTSLNEAYLCEYICYNRVFGIHTPFEGVQKIPPGSILTFDLQEQGQQQTQYWYPSLKPCKKSYNEIVREFIEIFRKSLHECIDPRKNYGLMLSGGSDSRLILSIYNNLISFHICDWMNREARLAQRVADTANSEFHLLQRNDSYYSDIINISSNINNFNGFFQEGHALGFQEEVTNNVDVMLLGMFSDALFKDHLFPLKEFNILNNMVFLPMKKEVDTLDKYLNLMSKSVPDYYEDFDTTREILEDNISSNNKINHHGINYNGLSDLVQQASYYPLTNDPDYFHYQSSLQLAPHRTPFLDKRMIEFHLTIPNQYRLRKDIINDAISILDSDLAKIPHSSTLTPLNYPYFVHWIMNNIRKFKEKYFPNDAPRPYLTDSPWPDYSKLLQYDIFGDREIETIQENIQSLPNVDVSAFNHLYKEVSDGSGDWQDVYSILTLGYMPAINTISKYHS